MQVEQPNNWIVITGGPSAGKSTTIRLLEEAGYTVVPEQAREIIAEQMQLGRSLDEIRGDGDAFQRMILQRQLEQEARFAPDQLVFFDRSVIDGFAYERFLHLTPNPHLERAARAARYRAVFLLETLHLHDDGSRIENDEEQRAITQALSDTYRELGFDPIAIKRDPPDNRVSAIVRTLDL